MHEAQETEQQSEPYVPEALRAFKRWLYEGQQWDWLYGGPCPESGCRGTGWLFDTDCVLTATAYCDSCTAVFGWDVTLDSLDWVSWALDVLGGRHNYPNAWEIAKPPSMSHHEVDEDWLQ